MQICELKVFANLLLDQPSPRSNAASVAYQGLIMMFGGTDAAGFKLNDLRFFDTVNNRWLGYEVPLNTPPVPRSNAAMLVLSSSRVALFGGASSTDTLSDVYFYDSAPCPVLDRTGWINIRSSSSGSFEWFDCATGFTHANGGNPLVCNPGTGIWQGVYHLPSRMVCLPAGPNQPTVNSVQALTATTARVVWSPPTNGAGVIQYIVEAAPDATYIERFTSSNGPSDLLTQWRWRNPDQKASYRFPGGQVRIDTDVNADCNVANNAGGCPWLSRSWPSAVPTGGEFAYEAWISYDTNVLQPQQFAGIGLVQDDMAVGQANDTLVLRAGLFRPDIGGGVQVTYGTGTNSISFSLTVVPAIWSCWIRIEKIASPSGAGFIYRASYRNSVRDLWIYLPSSISESQLNAGTGLDATRTRIAVLASNANTGRTASVIADNVRVSARGCQLAGAARVVPNTLSLATVTGLTPGGAYRFQVTAATNVVTGMTSAPSSLLQLPTATPTPVAPLTGNLARGRTTLQTGTQGGQSGNGVNGNLVDFFETAGPGQWG